MNRKYQLDTEENAAWLRTLREDLLRFGRNFPSPGGSAWYLGDDGTPWKEKNRETYCTARMCHVYSIGTFLGFEGSKALADAALGGLRGELRDTCSGGWYPGLTSQDQPLPDKLCYAHAFVILAASSGLIAGLEGAGDLMKEALEVFDRYFWIEEDGMTADTWNTAFTELDSYRGLNANMHTVEAFLGAADALSDELYRERAGRIISRVVKLASENEWRIPEHYGSDWKPDLMCNQDRPDDPFKPFGATPGHGLEWARLILQWALSSFRDAPEKAAPFIEASEQLFGRALSDGWNADGAPGLVYTTDWNGKPVVHDRMHWVLAEAINTSAVLYRTTKKPVYQEKYAMFMQYLDEKVLDHENGSWFHQMDRNNQPSGTVWPGKPDLYHAFQATLIPYYPADLSIALAVKQQNTSAV